MGAEEVVESLRQVLRDATPQGWRHDVDENGFSFFCHEASGETSWTLPAARERPPSAARGEAGQDAAVAALQQEIKRMKKEEKRLEKEGKKVALRETAMKSDINKMKAETKQAKKELAEGTKEADRRVAQAEEATQRALMSVEDQTLKIVEEHVEIIPAIVRALRIRDLELAAQASKSFRLVETTHVLPKVMQGVQEAIEENDAHVEKVASLEKTIQGLQEDLAFEKSERARENAEWADLVRQRDEEIMDLKATLAERDAQIAQLQTYIEETAERHRVELERARQHDQNAIVALEAQLELSKQQHEETMEEIAELWPGEIPPPSILRKYVIPLRMQEAAERQQIAQEELRIGSQVHAWDEGSANYFPATVTAHGPAEQVEIRWNAGSEDPPVWISKAHCFAIVEEDLYKQKTVGTQTTLALYDEDAIPRTVAKRPRSAIGRMDTMMEAVDRRASEALREKAAEHLDDGREDVTQQASAGLFNLIDQKAQGELELHTVWNAICEREDVRAYCEAHDVLAPLRRKEYLVLAWKHVEMDEDITMSFAKEEFVEACQHALKLAQRKPEARQAHPTNALDTVQREFAEAVRALEQPSDDDDDDEEEDDDHHQDHAKEGDVGSQDQGVNPCGELNSDKPALDLPVSFSEAQRPDQVANRMIKTFSQPVTVSDLVSPWIPASQRALEAEVLKEEEEKAMLLAATRSDYHTEAIKLKRFLEDAEEQDQSAKTALAEAETRVTAQTSTLSKAQAQVLERFQAADASACKQTSLNPIPVADCTLAKEELGKPLGSSRSTSVLHPGHEDFVVDSDKALNQQEEATRSIVVSIDSKNATEGDTVAVPGESKDPQESEERKFTDPETTTTADEEVLPESMPPALVFVPRLKWEDLRVQLAKHKAKLGALIERSGDKLQKERHAVRELQVELETIRTELADVQKESEGTQDNSLKEGLQSKESLVKQTMAGQEAKIRQAEELCKSLEDEAQALNASLALVSDFLDSLAAEREHLEGLHDELEASCALLSKCQDMSSRTTQLVTLWKEELELGDMHRAEQEQLIGQMEVVQKRFLHEADLGHRNLLELVEHKEILNARMTHAVAQIDAASNDLEMGIAKTHLGLVQLEVERGLIWASKRWESEMELRAKKISHQLQHAKDDCARLQASRRAVQERMELCAIIWDELKVPKDLICPETAAAATTASVSESRVAQLKALRALSASRESAWAKENLVLVNGLSTQWIADHERQRLQSQIDFANQTGLQKVAMYEDSNHQLVREMEALQGKYNALARTCDAQVQSLTNELETLARTSKESIDLLHAQLDTAKVEFEDLRRYSNERQCMTEEDLEGTKINLNARVASLKLTLEQNRHWINTLRDEVHELKQTLGEERNARAEEERKRADEKDLLRQELEAMTQHSARLDNWVNSLKSEVNMLNLEISEMRRHAERVAEDTSRRIQWLKWESWKRDETARTLGTNIDSCFAFFAETVARIVGSSKEANDRLAANAGVEVLLALTGSSRPELRRLALQAISAAGWNGHVDYRTLCRQAHDGWKRWVHGVTVVATLQWYRKADATTVSRRKPEPVERALQDAKALVEYGMTVRIVQNQIQIVPESVTRQECGMNMRNQKLVAEGLRGHRTGVEVLVDLLAETDHTLVEHSASTLSVLALDPESSRQIGEVAGVMENLLCLLEPCQQRSKPENHDKNCDESKATESLDNEADQSERRNASERPAASKHREGQNESLRGSASLVTAEKEEISRHALTALANLLFENLENQIRFGKMGGVEVVLGICKTSRDADVLDSASAVLANCTSLCASNCERIAVAEGLDVLVALCDSEIAQEALDDVGNRIQTNAVQALVNTTKEQSSKHALHLGELGVDRLVKLCFSNAVPVQQNAASIIQNIAQDDKVRGELGDQGAVEVMFTLCESEFVSVRSQALAALANLAWNAANQDRIGKLLPQLIDLCQDSEAQVREGASSTLANAMFYHEGNRRRFGLYVKAVRVCVKLLQDTETQPHKVHEHICRALGTAAYNDAVALQAGLAGAIPCIVALAKSQHTGVARTAAFALGNLAVHDVHKPAIIHHGGIEAMTALCGTKCSETVKCASKVLEIMADMSRAEEFQARREKYGIRGLVELCKGNREYDGEGNLLIEQASAQALACDELAAEVAQSLAKKKEALRCEAHRVLVAVLDTSIHLRPQGLEDPQHRQLQQRAIWAIRTLLQGGRAFQDIFGAHELTQILVNIVEGHFDKVDLGKGPSAAFAEQEFSVNLVHARDVCEAALSLLFSLVADHESNSRRLLQCGLRILVHIAEACGPKGTSDRTLDRAPSSMPGEAMGNLAVQILQAMGPHSWIRCQNCSSKERGGSCCAQCGHALRNEFVE
ncbi:Vacuolar protein 8 [Durusdinium trenchii]|uniref:Vacuolar protein 8 n=1 Tax=Durusdinium trenchii TaxID=1381693 RepID=A0ABP0S1B9_9DINO